jgi:periplasmic protein TonB
MASGRAQPSLALPLGGSALVHLLLLGLVFAFRPGPPPALPPIYRVTIIAAPVGQVAIGTVQPVPAKPSPVPTPPPRTKARPIQKSVPAPPKPATQKAPPKPATVATPVPPAQSVPPTQTKAPQAAGSAEGGHGADVGNVKLTEGIDFPFPPYLENIVRQIKLRFQWAGRGDLRAEVVFLIHRDGSITGFRFLSQSPVYSFNVEASGAVEQAGRTHAFGPLPSAFPDDVLPVIFSFDPRIIR